VSKAGDFTDALPRNPGGKILTQNLRTFYLYQHATPTGKDLVKYLIYL